jgi:DNA-binding MarR family transcriptional regulator
MSELYTRFDQTFFERTRLSIVTLIDQRRSISFTALKSILNVTDGALFSHLGKLIDAGYVSRAKQLTGDTVQTVYSLTPEGSRAYQDYLSFLQSVLQEHKEKQDEN